MSSVQRFPSLHRETWKQPPSGSWQISLVHELPSSQNGVCLQLPASSQKSLVQPSPSLHKKTWKQPPSGSWQISLVHELPSSQNGVCLQLPASSQKSLEIGRAHV